MLYGFVGYLLIRFLLSTFFIYISIVEFTVYFSQKLVLKISKLNKCSFYRQVKQCRILRILNILTYNALVGFLGLFVCVNVILCSVSVITSIRMWSKIIFYLSWSNGNVCYMLLCRYFGNIHSWEH